MYDAHAQCVKIINKMWSWGGGDGRKFPFR